MTHDDEILTPAQLREARERMRELTGEESARPHYRRRTPDEIAHTELPSTGAAWREAAE